MERNNYEKLCAIALNRIFGYEPKISHSLIDNLGSAAAVFELSEKDKESIFGPYSQHAPRIRREELEAAEAELARIRSFGGDFILEGDTDYPAPLATCGDAPIGLYHRSADISSVPWNGRTAISIVGTRNMTTYGRDVTRSLVEAIARSEAKPIIVSGLAIGIDITAHVIALECGLPTVAVLPTGIDEIYPVRHRAIAERIASTPGCALISDYPTGTSPVALNFLRRNRIIAGIGSATILAESRARGGGMMTARLAASYGRELFAIPGRVDDPASAGCNLLIHEKLAEPIVSMDSVCSDLGLGRFIPGKTSGKAAGPVEAVRSRYAGEKSPEELDMLTKVATAIKRNRGISVEELGETTGLGYSVASQMAGLLESDGIIEIDMLRCCTLKRDAGRRNY